MTDTQVMAALEPFAKLANVILSEAPAEADDIVLFTDCQRRPHAISMDQLRAASVALASSSPAEPVAWMYSGSTVFIDADRMEARAQWAHSQGWTETALYATPVPPPAGEADLCDQCGEYAHDCGGHPVAGDAKLRKAAQRVLDGGYISEYIEEEREDYLALKQALAAPPSVPAQQGWLPIETAPKTGEPVLIWKPDERMVGEYMMVAYWSDDHLVGEPGWIPVGGVHKQGYTSSVTGTDQGYPTHWMPLPATPPAQDQKGEEDA